MFECILNRIKPHKNDDSLPPAGEVKAKKTLYSRFCSISKENVKEKISLAFRKVPTLLNSISVPLSIIDVTGITSSVLNIIAEAGSLAFAAKDLHTHRMWKKEIVTENESADDNPVHELKAAVKKIHSLHSKFLVFDVVSSSIETTLAIGAGVGKLAIKIALLAGGISSPLATGLAIPLTVVPIGVKVVHFGVRRLLVIVYKPHTTKEILRGTEVKIFFNKRSLQFHRFTQKVQQRTVKKHNKQLAKLEEKRNSYESAETEKLTKIETKIGKAEAKQVKLAKNGVEKRAKIETINLQLRELGDKLIEAGWKDAKKHTKLGDCDIYAQALVDQYNSHDGLTAETDEFLKRHMGIDIRAVREKYPNWEVPVISRKIKKFFMKDEQEMVSFIQKQNRIARKAKKAAKEAEKAAKKEQ